MITCNINKPESTFDTIRKSYKDLVPTDIALLATALVESGRLADAVHDGKEYELTPDQHGPLTESLAREVAQIQHEFEGEKVTKKNPKSDEEVTLNLMLKPSVKAGDAILGDRKELKTLFGEILSEGVEFTYGPNDICWHWIVTRVNWATATQVEQRRRVRFNAEFVEPHVAVEVGSTTKKRKR